MGDGNDGNADAGDEGKGEDEGDGGDADDGDMGEGDEGDEGEGDEGEGDEGEGDEGDGNGDDGEGGDGNGGEGDEDGGDDGGAIHGPASSVGWNVPDGSTCSARPTGANACVPSARNGGNRANAGSILAVAIVLCAHARARLNGWSGNCPSHCASSAMVHGSRPFTSGAYGCGRTSAPTWANTAAPRAPLVGPSAHWILSTTLQLSFGTVNAAMYATPDSWFGIGTLSS